MSTERVIGEHTYAVQSLPARRQFKYLAQLRGVESALDVPEEVVNGLFETVTVDGKPLLPVVDALLRDKMDQFMEVISFALEVNYSDFFGVKKAGASPSPAPAPSLTAT